MVISLTKYIVVEDLQDLSLDFMEGESGVDFEVYFGLTDGKLCLF